MAHHRRHDHRRLLLASAAMGAFAAGFPAMSNPVLTATGSISVAGGGSYSETADNAPVNIIPYVYDSTSGSTGFIHAYAEPSGVFGARSSGQGVYDVTASTTFASSLHNSGSDTQMAVLSYNLSAGDVYVTGVGSASASLSFTISADGSTVASASLQEATVSGVETVHSATSDIAGFTYGAPSTGLGYSIPDQSGTIDLGLVAPGATLDFSYTISTQAQGTYDPATYTTYTYYESVPYGPYTTQTISLGGCNTVNNGGGAVNTNVPCGYGGYGGGTETVVLPAGYTLVPVTIEIPGTPNNYAEARSGDPLNAGFGNTQNGPFNTNLSPGGTTVSGGFSAAPEPSTYALVAAGLALTRIAIRRRRRREGAQAAA